MKICSKCRKYLEESRFYIEKSPRKKGRLSSRCKDCIRDQSSKYFALNKEKATSAHRLWVQNNRETVAFHKAKSAYKLTRAEYNSLIPICIICGSKERLRIDHSHQSGRVRGRLCDSCNKGLGFFRDDPTLMLRAADYVLGLAKADIFAATYEAVE